MTIKRPRKINKSNVNSNINNHIENNHILNYNATIEQNESNNHQEKNVHSFNEDSLNFHKSQKPQRFNQDVFSNYRNRLNPPLEVNEEFNNLQNSPNHNIINNLNPPLRKHTNRKLSQKFQVNNFLESDTKTYSKLKEAYLLNKLNELPNENFQSMDNNIENIDRIRSDEYPEEDIALNTFEIQLKNKAKNDADGWEDIYNQYKDLRNIMDEAKNFKQTVSSAIKSASLANSISPNIIGQLYHSPAIDSPDIFNRTQHSSEFHSPLDPRTIIDQMDKELTNQMDEMKENDIDESLSKQNIFLRNSNQQSKSNLYQNNLENETLKQPRKRDLLEEILLEKKKRKIIQGDTENLNNELIKFRDGEINELKLYESDEEDKLVEMNTIDKSESIGEEPDFELENQLTALSKSNEQLDRLIQHLEVQRAMSKKFM